MSKLVKVALVIVVLSCLGSLVLTFKIGSDKSKLKTHNTQLTSDNNRLSQDLSQTKSQLAQSQQQLQQTRADLDETKTGLATAQAKLDDKTKEANALKAQVAELAQLSKEAKTQLTAATETLEQIRKAMGAVDLQNVDQIRNRLTALDDENKVLSDRLSAARAEKQKLQEEVELLRESPIGLRGKVALVQDNWNFLVLDIGQQQRVRPNTQFIVYRNGKMIGKVQVTSIGPNTSVAEVLTDYSRGAPRVGDMVVH
jgi:predicted  nucleic acid-binding Zn-ribbon protein